MVKPNDVVWHLSDGVKRVADEWNFGRLISEKKGLILNLKESEIKSHVWTEGNTAFCLSVVDTKHLSVPVLLSKEPHTSCYVRLGITIDGETRYLVPSFTGISYVFVDKKGQVVGEAPESVCGKSLLSLYHKRTVQYTVPSYPGFRFTMVKKSEHTDNNMYFDLPGKGPIIAEITALDPKGKRLFVTAK